MKTTDPVNSASLMLHVPSLVQTLHMGLSNFMRSKRDKEWDMMHQGIAQQPEGQGPLSQLPRLQQMGTVPALAVHCKQLHKGR